MPRVQDAIPSLDCRAWKGRSNPLFLSALRFAPESRPGERDQIERQRNLVPVGDEPCARRLRIGRDRAPEQSEARQGQQRKDDPRDGGGLRGFQSGLGEAVDLAHALNRYRIDPQSSDTTSIRPSRIALMKAR